MTAVISGLLKTYFMSPRPINSVITLLDPSFPSSHASMAAAVLFVVLYIFAPTIKSWIKRETMIVICVIGIIAIGASRLILNVHWFSDIIAGWSVGIFVATGSVILVKYISELLIKKKYV
jgi:undecaprenyl-diphosphatase